MASTDPTVITIDVETGNYSSVSYPTLAPANNPTFTGTVTATSASAVYFPTNTSIGVVTSSEIAALSGITGNIQAQLNTINLASPAGDILLPSKTGNQPASLIFEGGVPDDFEASITPQNPVQDFTFYLPAPAAGTFAITGSTGSDHTTFVGDNLIQTLTNKTLTSPTITGTINNLNLPTGTQSGSKIVSSYFYKVTNDSGNSNTTIPLVPTGFPTATGQIVKAGKTYHFKIVGLYSVNAVSTTVTHRLNFSAGSVGSVTSYNATTTTTISAIGTTNWQTSNTTLVSVTPSPNTQTSTMNMSLEGWFTPTADGYFYYDFTPSANTMTVKYGTFMLISEVG